MNIVSNNLFLRNLRNLDFFELDLGKSKRLPGKEEFRKLDEFAVKYNNIYERDIVKFGKIGDKVFFYEDFKVPSNTFLVFKDADIYEINYEDGDLVDMKNYILDILRRVDNFENKEKEAEEMNNQYVKEHNTYENDFWIANDEKNKGKKYLIDQTLSREEYRKKLEEKFYNEKTNE